MVQFTTNFFECIEDTFGVFDETENIPDRIKRLKKVAADYPEYIIPVSAIANSYVEMGDIDNMIIEYQKLINMWDTFEDSSEDELCKAYLLTNEYEKALKTIENSDDFSMEHDILYAFSSLKNGNRNEFKQKFDEWTSMFLEGVFAYNDYEKYIKILFDEDDSKFIKDVWKKYYDEYLKMDEYELYCELYKQAYGEEGYKEDDCMESENPVDGIAMNDDYVDLNLNLNYDIPPFLSRSGFLDLSAELHELNESYEEHDNEERKRWVELQKTFASVILNRVSKW